MFFLHREMRNGVQVASLRFSCCEWVWTSVCIFKRCYLSFSVNWIITSFAHLFWFEFFSRDKLQMIMMNVFWDRILLSSLGWPGIHSPPASASWDLESRHTPPHSAKFLILMFNTFHGWGTLGVPQFTIALQENAHLPFLCSPTVPLLSLFWVIEPSTEIATLF